MKTALVTGIANTQSIAYGIAVELSKAGYNLIVTYQTEKTKKFTERCVEDINYTYNNVVEFIRYDYGADNTNFSATVNNHNINCVVHSIAFSNLDALNNPVIKLTRDGFLTAIDYSCFSLIDLVQCVNGAMADGGSVVTLSYLGADRAVEGYNVMGIAKAALQSTVRYLALDLSPRGVRVNSVSPGPVKTRAASGIKAIGDIARLHERVGGHNQVYVDIHDVGRAVVALNNIPSINGQNIILDNGFTVLEPVHAAN